MRYNTLNEEEIRLIEKNIKWAIKKVSKKYIGKGPEYVKVKVNRDTINLIVKGIVSNTGNLLLKQGENDLIKIIWGKLKKLCIEETLFEFYKVSGENLQTISEVSDFQKDVRTMVLKIVK